MTAVLEHVSLEDGRPAAAKQPVAVEPELHVLGKVQRHDSRFCVFTLATVAALVLGFVVFEIPGSTPGFWEGHGQAGTLASSMILWPPAVLNGQFWRILTSPLIHVGVLHLAVNVTGLVTLGTATERRLGARRTALIFAAGLLVSGVAAALVFPHQYGAGASGGVTALAGALVALLIHEPRQRHALGWVGALVVGLVVSWFTAHGISWAAHCAGLITGCLVAWRMRSDRPRIFANATAPRIATVLPIAMP